MQSISRCLAPAFTWMMAVASSLAQQPASNFRDTTIENCNTEFALLSGESAETGSTLQLIRIPISRWLYSQGVCDRLQCPKIGALGERCAFVRLTFCVRCQGRIVFTIRNRHWLAPALIYTKDWRLLHWDIHWILHIGMHRCSYLKTIRTRSHDQCW